MQEATVQAWGWYNIKIRETKRTVEINGIVYNIWESTKKNSKLKFIKAGDVFKGINFYPLMSPKVGDTYPVVA